MSDAYDLPKEIRDAIGDPVTFFPACVYRHTPRHVSMCNNPQADLYRRQCSKRCLQNVTHDMRDLKAKLKVLYGKLLAKQEEEEQDLKDKTEAEKTSKRFNEYLKQARAEVDSWPEWKKCLWRKPMPDNIEAREMQSSKGTQEIARSERSDVRDPKERRITVGEQQDLGAAMVKEPANLKSGDIRKEMWRTYTWIIPETGVERSYTIEGPVKVLWRDGGTTHRVVDNNGIAHCVPIPGSHGCVLTWKNRDPMAPVNW